MTFSAFSLLYSAQVLATVLNPIIFTHGEKRRNVWSLDSVESINQSFNTNPLINPRNVRHRRTAA